MKTILLILPLLISPNMFALENSTNDLNKTTTPFIYEVHSYTQADLFQKAQKELVNKEYKDLYETLKLCNNYGPCQTMIGFIYENGLYVEQNSTKAIKEFKKAIKQESVEAMYNLGTLYMKKGKYAKAKVYLEMAVQKSSKEANYNLGLFFIYGWGETSVDYKKALSYMKKAKELGYLQAQKPITWLKKQLKE